MIQATLPALRRLALAGLFALAACETPVQAPKYPEITFQHLQPIKLDVSGIEYVQTYAAPNAAPNVEHLFPANLAEIARRWVDERLEAVGVMRTARVTLIDASVIETELEKREGLLDLFYEEQAQRYDGSVEMLIEIVDSRGLVVAHARASAQHSRTAAEDISINEREQLWFALTESLMRDLDKELEIVIRRYLAEYVR